MAVWIGLDLGGTRMRAIAFDLESPARRGAIRGRAERPTPEDREGVLAAVRATVAEALAAVGTPVTPSGIGVGAPGPVDTGAGVLLVPPNMPCCRDLPLGQTLFEGFGVPVRVENDANAAALGEHRQGAGQGARDMVYVTISTGIGGGVLIGGRLVRGAAGSAGEVGHMVIEPEGPPCGCGSRGCWEQMASGTALGRLGQAAAAAGRAPRVLAAAGGDPGAVRAEHVVAAAREGEAAAADAVHRVATYVGLGLVNILNVLGPDVVVIGGGLSQAWDDVVAPGIELARARAFKVAVDACRFVPARLGDDAGTIGAAWVAVLAERA